MTLKSSNPGAGLGDPYWFEWSIGLEYVLDLLDPAKNVSTVTLQKSGHKGLDDVVVSFSDGHDRFIQVKHTRAKAPLTFGDIVTGDDKRDSLLKDMAAGWIAAGKPAEVWLVTNRQAGKQQYTPRTPDPISRPPLADFMDWLETESTEASQLSDVEPLPGWEEAWYKLWLAELSKIKKNADKLDFLKAFRVFHSESNLSEMGDKLQERLEALFMVPPAVAEGLLARLDSALRKWGTSDRGTAEAITKEAAYEKLCLQQDTIVGDHDFPPPAPFFPSRLPDSERVAALLRKRDFPVVFVTGEPGSGKTALLSHLANQRNPIIGVRFHAYRPITPENQLLPADSEVTKPHTLWSDLLVKLRPLVRDRLYQLKIPVHAGSLSTEKLRDHVLRIANALGEAEGMPFVIAIDGIDHAARAGERSDTFLAALVPPDEVPEHVVFLIGGQPSESYQRQYPVWLRPGATEVKTYELPRLTLDDTRALVESRLATRGTVVESVTRDVYAACEGHTLSTVFAVEEAVFVDKNPDLLPQRLTNRNLSSGVEGYYEAIWSAATKGLLDASALRLASCLALTRSRTTGGMVQAVLDPDRTDVLNSKDLLRQLRPLVVEESGGFRVFHNDFRVFLHRLLKGDVETYKECASALGDYLLGSDDQVACHASVQMLYGIAERHREQAALFTPSYVLEGHAIGRPLYELSEQALVAAEALAELDMDWRLAHQVSAGLKTLEQLRASLDWREGLEVADTADGALTPPRAVERSVPEKADWTHDRVEAALDDIMDLCHHGEIERAHAAFERWFTGLSPKEIADLAQFERGVHEKQKEEAIQTLLSGLGSASISTARLLKVSTGTDWEIREAAYARGLLNLADSHSVGDRAFKMALRRVRTFYLPDLEELLWRLIENCNWPRCAYILKTKTPHNELSWSFRISCALLAALLGREKLQRLWTTPILTERDNAVAASVDYTGPSSGETSQITVMTRLALLFGIMEPNRNASAIREEIETAYKARDKRDDRHDAGVAELLHAAALLGSLIHSTREAKSLAVHCAPSRVARTVQVLITATDRQPYQIPIGYPQIATSIVRGILECARQRDELSSTISEPLLDRITQNKTLGPMLTPVWRFLVQAAHRQELLSYADAWIGVDGIAWTLPVDERHEFVTEFASLLKEVDELDMAEHALNRLPWTDIGFTGHKDYSLAQALEWFNKVAAVDSKSWENQGLRLFSVSREATRTGDNRLGRQIETSVLATACLEGPEAVARITLADGTALEPGDDTLVYALVQMLEVQTLPRSKLLAIWAFSIGQQCWRVQVDRKVLADIRDACLAAQHDEDRGLEHDFRQIGAAEFACQNEDETSSPLTSQDKPDYSALSPIDAIQLAGAHQDWRQVAASLCDAKATGGGSYAECIDEAWAALKGREERIWWFDGAHKVYEHVFPLLQPSQRWEEVSRTVLANDFPSAGVRINTIQENLNAMCLLVASQAGLKELQAGLEDLLQMHTLWVEGGGRLSSIAQVPVDTHSSLNTWSQVFLELLLHLLEYDEQTYAQTALRGIFELLKTESGLLADLLGRLPNYSERVHRRFMLIVEAVAAEEPSQHFCEWLAGVMEESSRLDTALSAWNALLVATRISDGSEPSWPAPTDEPQRIVLSSPPLVSGIAEQTGLHVTAARASLSKLEYLEAACSKSIDDVASDFASSIRSDPPEPDPPLRRTRVVGDLSLDPNDEAEIDRLFKVLRNHERKCRFDGVDTGRLTQALLPPADPFVFLKTLPHHTDTNGWPIDSVLNERMSESSEILAYELLEFLYTDLPGNLRVLGGSVTSYSGEWDFKVLMHHRLAGGGKSYSEPPRVLNARTSLMLRDFDMIRGPNSNDDWLTWEVSGLFPFIDGTADVFPSLKWQQLGWQPSPLDPTRWEKEGSIVAWYERLLGPVRRVSPGEPIYRHPILTRWVCTSDEWTRLQDQLGEPERSVSKWPARYQSR